jgi:hypothetical protein
MYSRGVLVHCPSCLRAAVAVQAAEIPGGEGVFAKSALERAKTFHHSDGVMSHGLIVVLMSSHDSELKTTARHARNGRRLALTIQSMCAIAGADRSDPLI